MTIVFDNAPPDRLRPPVIPDATWQAGRTPRNSQYRASLDGEPVPLAVAANVSAGWVDVMGDDGTSCLERDGLGRVKIIRRHGIVQLLRCRGE